MGRKMRGSCEHFDLRPQVGLSPQKGVRLGRMKEGRKRAGIPHFPLQVVHMAQPVKSRALSVVETGDRGR